MPSNQLIMQICRPTQPAVTQYLVAHKATLSLDIEVTINLTSFLSQPIFVQFIQIRALID